MKALRRSGVQRAGRLPLQRASNLFGESERIEGLEKNRCHLQIRKTPLVDSLNLCR
jgi:hypothetical protein